MKNKTTPRIAVIGCGAITENFYLPAIARQFGDLDQITLVDRNEDRLHSMSKLFSIEKTATGYQDVLGQVDGVIIATPNQFHSSISIDFLNNGAHVLCEKPLAENTSQAEEVVNTADKRKVTVGVNNTRRLFPSYRRIKDLIIGGEIGKLRKIQYFEGNSFNWPTSSGFYFNSKESPKGVLMDRGAHVLDLVCWWLEGRPTTISSENDSYGGPEAVAQIKFEHNSCIGEIKLSWVNKLSNTYLVEGEDGCLSGSIYDFRSTVLTKNGTRKKINLQSKASYFSDFAHLLINNFVNVISNKEVPLISGREVLDSISWLEESYKVVDKFKMSWDDIWRNQNET